MKNSEEVILIKGEFTADDAKDVLLNLINFKINFHQMKNFGLHERTGKKDEQSLKRIEELKESKQQILSIVDEAKAASAKLKIDSTINIAVTESSVAT